MMTDGSGAWTCRCGCGRALPPPPVHGGRAPDYASRACQQRAYRARQATRTPPADPASVAGLLAAVRALAATLDTGAAPQDGQVAAVREGSAALLARADTAVRSARPAPTAPPADRHVTTESGSPDTAPAARLTVTAPSGRTITLSPALAAAVSAATDHADQPPTLARDPDGWTVHLAGVPLGLLRPGYTARGDRRGWQPLQPGAGAPTDPRVHPSRGAAAAALIVELQALGRHVRDRNRSTGRHVTTVLDDDTVRQLRDQEETWAQIGARAGLSARQARSRWGHLVPREWLIPYVDRESGQLHVVGRRSEAAALREHAAWVADRAVAVGPLTPSTRRADIDAWHATWRAGRA
ncbi:hypothetical protein [Protofrankia symbiont of Coriaria ruscifolia]|uniref:hypothetical protein n=1 Tax=Protofrankia symbiont of Coriaria ruscifolia TaxID=1306542 RepID=UPI001041BA74|nr:hypothetical protein [Protofrankia symbiont of Coriaria ruscifolia]